MTWWQILLMYLGWFTASVIVAVALYALWMMIPYRSDVQLYPRWRRKPMFRWSGLIIGRWGIGVFRMDRDEEDEVNDG